MVLEHHNFQHKFTRCAHTITQSYGTEKFCTTTALRTAAQFQRGQTHRFDGLLQAEDLLLQQMQCAGFATMTGECRRTRAMNAIHPVLQFDLLN